ncbi:putative ATPase [Cyclonatronum proteinivorum]|uniref:Replication-associated recombination protein A n=2 Tax=Cyclonatronum proteinivorum TaxID=1457365 RepID=A0A345UNB3_9BACT|nr:putative ATPase [Cyclonatronum proteinivorum]
MLAEFTLKKKAIAGTGGGGKVWVVEAFLRATSGGAESFYLVILRVNENHPSQGRSMDLFEEKQEGGRKPGNRQAAEALRAAPLATRMRPVSLAEFVGQRHLLAEGKLLYRMIRSGQIGSVILYGPASSGKTTLANVISQEIDARFVVLNAVLDGIKELRAVVEEARTRERMQQTRTILFVDEIHRWNKAQQDALLPHIESGLLTLIGATTENPYYSLVSPLLSRCQLFELYPFDEEDLLTLLRRALGDQSRGLARFNIEISDEALWHFASYAAGDIRNALNALEMAVLTTDPDATGTRRISLEVAQESIQKRNVRFSRQGDEHYHYASALIKSLRGSDADAALHWLAAMLEGGEDPQFIFRRFLIFASEDVGMAEPKALELVQACLQSFETCGMPEGLYFMSHACLYLALCPKSNSTKAIFKALDHVRKSGPGTVPPHLRDRTANRLKARYESSDNPSENYRYPHEYPNNWVAQQYLPDEFPNLKHYEPGTSPVEERLNERLKRIRDSKI